MDSWNLYLQWEGPLHGKLEGAAWIPSMGSSTKGSKELRKGQGSAHGINTHTRNWKPSIWNSTSSLPTRTRAAKFRTRIICTMQQTKPAVTVVRYYTIRVHGWRKMACDVLKAMTYPPFQRTRLRPSCHAANNISLNYMPVPIRTNMCITQACWHRN